MYINVQNGRVELEEVVVLSLGLGIESVAVDDGGDCVVLRSSEGEGQVGFPKPAVKAQRRYDSGG
jgi:hypothetical protein